MTRKDKAIAAIFCADTINYIGNCYTIAGDEFGTFTGTHRVCQLEGCSGIRLGVRWPDSRITWPCSRGLIQRENGDWQIA